MRILFFSNAPWSSSGYGTQTKLFVPKLQALGHQMSVSAFYGLEGGIIDWNGIPIYPKGNAMNVLGVDVGSMAQNARHFKADCVISLLDLWVMPPNVSPQVPYFPWFPIDSEPLSPAIARSLQGVAMPLVFSRFAERVLMEAGVKHRYVPHGVDTNVYAPMPQAEARSVVMLPQDQFIVGIVAANKGVPCRKAIKQQIEAFARLHRKHADTMLYIHALAQPGDGENLLELCGQLGLTSDCIAITDPYAYCIGLEEEKLRALYASFDVLSNVAMGEGFGLTILEAQACGVPVIVGDWTSMSELNFSGWAVPKSEAEPYHTPLASYQYWPKVDAIFEQMEAAYLASDRSVRSAQARTEACEYDGELVTRAYWKPVLEELEHLARERTTPKSFQDFLSVARSEEVVRAS